MENSAYTISTRMSGNGQADVLIYSEGEERSIEFNCRAALDPVPVWIPLGRWWNERAPPWAQARRDTIVERVRASGAIVYEAMLDPEYNTVTTIQSPDRSFRVECREEPDERAPAWERTRIVATAGDEVLADLRLHGVKGTVEFPWPGVVTLDLLGRYGDRQRLRVDATRRVFHLDGDAEFTEHPLHLLAARLAPPALAKRAPLHVPAKRQAALEYLIGIIGVPFALGGLWLALSGKTGSDRLAGIGGIVMGGFAIAGAMTQWRRQRGDQPARATLFASRLAAYVPLIAVGVELAWLVVLLVGFLFVFGDAPYTHTPGAASVHLWDLIAALPALAGLSFGIACILRGRIPRVVDWFWLLVGCAGCGVFVVVFGWEFFH